MRSGMIAFAAGVMLVARLPALPGLPRWLLILFLLLLVSALCWLARRQAAGKEVLRRAGRRLSLLSLTAATGFLWGLLHAQAQMAAMLPQALEGRDIWIRGRIDSLPRDSGRARRFEIGVGHHCYELLPEDCRDGGWRRVSQRLLLSDYSGLELAPGQQWRLRVRLNRPRGLANPGGRDYRANLLGRGIQARGYVRQTSLNRLLEEGRGGFDRWRMRLRRELLALSERPERAAVALALMTGDRQRISDRQWDLFSGTGTNHLIVISGLHVGLVAALAWHLGAWLARLSPALLLRVAAPRIGALGAIAGALVYALLAGFSLPTQRALVMISVFMAARAAGRRLAPGLGLAAALAVVLALDPLAGTRAGFWLSFVSVAALLYVFGGLNELSQEGPEQGPDLWERLRRLWRRWGQAQWVAFLALIVPLAVWMQQISLVAPLANLLAIPLVSLALVPLALLLVLLLSLQTGLAGPVLRALEGGIGLLEGWLEWIMAVSPAAVLPIHGVNTLALVCAAAGCALLLAPPGWPGKYLAALLFLPLLWPDRAGLPEGQARVTVLDVGQGLAVVVRTAGHVLVYDAGPRMGEGFDAGRAVVLPFLRARGIGRIDRLVLTHGHADHSGGAAALRESLAPSSVLSGEALPGPMQSGRCRDDQHWVRDDVRFEMLHPPAGNAGAWQGNEASCVLRISAGGESLLLTGDIERRAEQQLLARHGERLDADVLLIPHHGSSSSSGAAFVEAVAPDVAVYSAGYANRFGHPADAVLERYRRHGVAVYGTDISGALGFRLGDPEEELRPSEYRRERRRYWHR